MNNFYVKELDTNRKIVLSYDAIFQNNNDGATAVVTLAFGNMHAGKQIRCPMDKAYAIFNALFEYIYTLVQIGDYTIREIGEYARSLGM